VSIPNSLRARRNGVIYYVARLLHFFIFNIENGVLKVLLFLIWTGAVSDGSSRAAVTTNVIGICLHIWLMDLDKHILYISQADKSS
jgi:hypothetical protein